jgi:hypothetical protein
LATDIRDLSNRIRGCDPGHYLTRAEVAEVLNRIRELEEMESSDYKGHLGWFYMKVKANADYYNCSFQIPERWAHLYEDYKADLEIYGLSQPFQALAILLRNFGMRRSFIQGNGRGKFRA